MADFAPPPGPPPPKVPEGWKAQWSDQYKEWFYVNIYTKKSQWDKPTEPIYSPPDAAEPDGPPPSYSSGGDAKPAPSEKSGLGSNNPWGPGASSSHPDISEDERLARQLQAEEDARARGGGSGNGTPAAHRGASDGYYGAPGAQGGYGQPSPYGQSELPPRPEEKGKKGGFLGKLLGKASGSSGHHQQQPHYGGGYPTQQNYYGGAPQGQYGYAPQQGYYGQGGYPQQQYVQQRPHKSGGMGAGGAAALGVGGGLLGGMLLADAIDDHEDHAYDQGYEDGQDIDFGGGGDDFGGGDF